MVQFKARKQVRSSLCVFACMLVRMRVPDGDGLRAKDCAQALCCCSHTGRAKTCALAC